MLTAVPLYFCAHIVVNRMELYAAVIHGQVRGLASYKIRLKLSIFYIRICLDKVSGWRVCLNWKSALPFVSCFCSRCLIFDNFCHSIFVPGISNRHVISSIIVYYITWIENFLTDTHTTSSHIYLSIFEGTFCCSQNVYIFVFWSLSCCFIGILFVIIKLLLMANN